MEATTQPPLDVWELLRDPILAFYQDGKNKKTIEGILSVINNSCPAKKHWYIPLPVDYCDQESQALREEQHTAFCTWLLGRLFCILGRDSLLDIHLSCLKAQTGILEVCAENQFMIRFFFLEYMSCLTDILAFQTSESFLTDGPQLLRRFTPVPSKALENLNLTAKYILLKSQAHVITLEQYLVEILDSMIPNIVLLNEDLVEKCWFVLCQLTQIAPPTIKVATLKIFSKIIAADSCNQRTTMADLCNTLKHIIQSSPLSVSNGPTIGSESEHDQKLLTGIGELINVIITFAYCKDNIPRIKDFLNILHSVIFMWDVERNKGPGLGMAVSNVTKLLAILPSDSVNPDSFSFLMKRYETQQFAVQILEKCICDQLIGHIKSSQQYQSVLKPVKSPTKDIDFSSIHINTVTSLPLWTTLYDQLWEDVASIQSNFPGQPSKQMMQGISNAVGRVMSSLKCAVGVDMLYVQSAEARKIRASIIFFPQKVTKLISFLQFLMQQLVFLKSNGLTVWFAEDIIKSTLLSLRYIFLLPEVFSNQVEGEEIALSIVVIPWIENIGNTESLMDFSDTPALFPEVKSEEMKVISLNTLVNISCLKAQHWKSLILGRIMSALNEPSEVRLVVEAIHALPAFLLDSHLEQSELLHSILLPTLKSNSDIILTSVSEIFSSIVCVLSGDVAAMSLQQQGGDMQKSFVCLTCHKDFPGSSVGAKNVLDLYKDFLNKFMALLTCQVVAVRRNMVASLGSLVLHLPSMYQADTVQKLMNYAEDEDHKVRLTFSGMVKFLIFSRDWMEGKEVESDNLREEHIPLTQVDRAELFHSRPRLNRVLQLLYSAFITRLSAKTPIDVDVQGTLLKTIVDVGCVPLDCTLLPVMKIVLLCVSHPAFSQPSLGQVYLKRIAVAHNTNVEKLYHRFQTDLCQILVTVMGMNFHARPLSTKCMDKVLDSFGFESTSEWLRSSLKCVLPSLMVLVVKFKDTAFLTKIIELLPDSAASVIKDNFKFIYPYAFLNESDHIVEECVKVMEEMSGTNAQQLMVSSFKTIHNELLLHYHSKKERVEEGICQLINVEKMANDPQKLSHTPIQADIAKHVKQRFLGVLVHFDSLLESSSAEESNKIKVLQSLPQIIRLMGSKYITPVRFKVLSTLRTALCLTHCDFPHLSCGAWEAFIHSVDIHELGSLLGTVAASLLPLLDQFPDEVSAMLEWLVVRHEHDLSEHIPDLFFLPDISALSDVHKVVQHHVMNRRRVLNESQKLVDYLQQPLRFITHDNVDIRQHGLKYLLSLLKEKQAEFTKSLLQEEIVHDNVAKLLSLLIEGCRDTDQELRLLCVENLGMLGALDPGHLPHKKPEIAMPQITSVDEGRFAVQALTALAKAYQAARNTRYLDSFALAIQELLKSYSISSQPQQSRKNLWDLFPVSIQQVMAPLENTSYYMTSLHSNYVWPHPLFGTRYASTLTNWAHTWACRIVKYIDDSEAKDMFTVCIPSLKRDINCVLFFLPFILLYAVISGQEDQHKMMVEEMTFIIQQRSLKEEEEEVEPISASEKFQVHWDRSIHLPRVVDSDSTTHALCAKTVFSLLDFMEKWTGWSRKRSEDCKDFSSGDKKAMNIQKVQKFLSEFSKLDLAYGNYGVNEYARALMYLEDHLMEHKELLKDEEHLSFLERIYAQLNEPDGIKGVLAIQCSQPKLLEAVVYHEVAGQYQEALACYELLAKQHSSDAFGVRVQKGMIRCCLSLDQPYAALHIAEGAMSKRLECRSAFLEAQAECFWRMNNFENLDTVLRDPQLENSNAWGVSIGKCLIDIRHGNQTSLSQHLCSTRSFLSKALSSASLENGSYLQGYPHVIKLHLLQELEEGSKVITMVQSKDISEQLCIAAVQNLVKVWEDRLSLVQAASSVQEPLLRLRRCLLKLASSCVQDDQYSLAKLLDQELGTSWLKSAEVARVAEHFQQSYIYLLNAEKYKPKRHFIELAKLHWEKNEQDHALATLRRGLDEHFPNSKEFKNMPADAIVEDRKICAEAKLLVAHYNDKNMNVNFEDNVSNYRDAVDVYQQWEKSHVFLAQFYDRMSLSENSYDMSSPGGMYLWAILSYIKSLRFGCSMVYHSMSRMLTIWLDFGKRYHSVLKSAETTSKKMLASLKTALDRMNKFIGGHVDMLPSYMFMTGFSQLVSRICHPVAEVYGVIKTIIVKLLLCYPQQTLWMLVAMNRSSYALRKHRCQGILEDPQVKRKTDLVKLTTDFVNLGQHLYDLCHKPVNKDLSETTVSSIARNLPKLLGQSSFSKIMVPLQHCRTLTLPQQEFSSMTNHLPFPIQVPYIAGIKEKVTILSSLQRPRKITFIGTDGQYYDMMCKDKDDLRLDARVMEFNSIVNKYLQKNPASRSRNLNIRTYSVVPINEESGLIEWVPNLKPLRVILTELYKEMGRYTSTREIKKYILGKDAPLQEKKDVFVKNLVPLHPPVLGKWFRNNFSDSRSWFEARKSYVHKTAVMSMVGYILGLGDRHGENLLLDTTCGDLMHVDFNCLFNRGERFDCPERVPFRLTHNMVSAMGPTGVEGPFRIACEKTLYVLRAVRETLLSVLQPFVYDPKIDETSNSLVRKLQSSKTVQDEVTNDFAVENVKKIGIRLNGIMTKQSGTVQLSLEGHTQVLIQEATSIDNLCQMYIGWGPYL